MSDILFKGMAMLDHVYRFRPVDRLLSKENSEGELEGLYFYFASPEQLNDPLEGYRDLYWSGDEVVWKNLLRHYLFCLTLRAFQYLADNTEKEGFPRNYCYSNGTDEIRSIVDGAYSEFIAEEQVSSHISTLAQGRQFRREELEVNLGSMHAFALLVIGRQLMERSFISDSWAPEKHITDFLGSSRGLVNLYKSIQPTESSEEFFDLQTDIVSSLVSARNLERQYRLWGDNTTSKGWHALTVHFTRDFCRNLEYLNYPDWYVACFMTDCTDASIWGSYGQNHKAVCLKFKTCNLGEKTGLDLWQVTSVGTGGKKYGYEFSPLEEVAYGKEFVSVDFFSTLGNHPVPVLKESWYTDEAGNYSKCGEHLNNDPTNWRANYWRGYQDGVTTKLADWHGEKEYRIVLYSGLTNFSDISQRKVKYKFEALEGIIFGMATPDDDKIKIIKSIESLCRKHDRKTFSFYQSFYNRAARKIDIRPMAINFFNLE